MLQTTEIQPIRINLVKAFELGLTLRQAATLSAIHQIIKRQVASFADIDDDRWWFIDGETIMEFSPMLAEHPATATQHLLALQLKKLIVIDEFDTALGIKSVLKINHTLILMEADDDL